MRVRIGLLPTLSVLTANNRHHIRRQESECLCPRCVERSTNCGVFQEERVQKAVRRSDVDEMWTILILKKELVSSGLRNIARARHINGRRIHDRAEDSGVLIYRVPKHPPCHLLGLSGCRTHAHGGQR